jgi:multimeric flavodoxin WrbA
MFQLLRLERREDNMNVLLVNGYLRENGNTARLSDAFAKRLREADIEPDVVELRNMSFQNCLNCGKCGSEKLCAIDDEVTAHIYKRVLESDAIILTSPVYMWNMTGVLKTFLDRLHCYSKKYGGKRMGVIVTSHGGIESGADIIEESLKRFCEFCNIKWAGMLFAQCLSRIESVEGPLAVSVDKYVESLIS